MSVDLCVENHGSIVLLRPISPAAREWVETNIGQDNGYQPYWPTVLMEPRYVMDVVNGAVSDGLSVR